MCLLLALESYQAKQSHTLTQLKELSISSVNVHFYFTLSYISTVCVFKFPLKSLEHVPLFPIHSVKHSSVLSSMQQIFEVYAHTLKGMVHFNSCP